MKYFEAYWRHEAERVPHHGIVLAENRDDAYEIVTSYLQKGYHVTHVYEVDESRITPQSVTVNFPNTTDYHLFG